MEMRSRIELQGVEHEYPALIDQGKLAAPGETRDLRRSVGGRKLALLSELYLRLLHCSSPTPQVSDAVRLIVSCKA